MYGSTFCLHDDALKQYKRVNGAGLKNDSVTAKVVTGGNTNTEQKYIEDAEKAGDFVVRSSDGLLRRLGEAQPE